MFRTKSMFTINEFHNYVRMPWKNGLGETLEIHKNEDDQGIRYRISQAAVVEDGRFSDFSGLQRTLILLSGQGMTLTHPNASGKVKHELLKPLDQAVFDGGEPTNASLHEGAIDDLNVMVRDCDTSASVVSIVAPNERLAVPDTALLCGFYALESASFDVANDAGKPLVNVSANGFIQFHQPCLVDLKSGRGVWVVIVKKQ